MRGHVTLVSRSRQRGASSVETGIAIALIALVATAALTSFGRNAGGEDIDTAAEAIGNEPTKINATNPDGPSAGNGAGGNTGIFGSTAEGVSGTGLKGGFESESSVGGYWNTHHAGQMVGEEWEVVSGSVDAHLDHDGRFDMSVEGQFLDLNGHGAGHIRRTVDVIPDAHYNLSIDIGENVYGGPAVKQMEVIWNGQVVSTLEIDLPAEDVKTFTVALPPFSGDEGVLEFRSLLGSAHGPVIDNPTLTYIPDPNN